MTLLALGLLIFLGAHSIRIVADDWRGRQIARIGSAGWRIAFSLVSALGLILIVMGYGETRIDATVVWQPARWTAHVTALLTLPAFVLIVAAYIPGSRIRASLAHPMILGVKLWAFAHLLSNGRAGDLLLFGAFLAWAIADFASARRRDRRNAVTRSAGSMTRDAAVVAVGVAAWALFALVLHGPLIGVRPFG